MIRYRNPNPKRYGCEPDWLTRFERRHADRLKLAITAMTIDESYRATPDELRALLFLCHKAHLPDQVAIVHGWIRQAAAR